MRAIPKQLIDLGFLDHLDVLTKLIPQIRKSHVTLRPAGQRAYDRHRDAAQHDALGRQFSEIWQASAGTHGRHGGFMRDHIVFDAFRSGTTWRRGFSRFAHHAPYVSAALIVLVGLYTGWSGWHGLHVVTIADICAA